MKIFETSLGTYEYVLYLLHITLNLLVQPSCRRLRDAFKSIALGQWWYPSNIMSSPGKGAGGF